MIKGALVRLMPSLPYLRGALEHGKHREIVPFIHKLGVKAGIKLWYSLRCGPSYPKDRLLRLQPKQYSHPIHYRPFSSDPKVIHQTVYKEEYSSAAKLRNIEYIVDCGANIGCTSYYLLHRFPNAKLIAIEPDPDNMSLCQKNLEPFKDRVKAGVWSSVCNLQIDRGTFRDGAEWSFRVKEVFPGEPYDTVATTINEVLSKASFPRIDLLKVDIEGAESVVFNVESSDWLGVTNNIIIELHGPECEIAVETSLSRYKYKYIKSTSGELSIYEKVTTQLSAITS